MKGHGTRLHSRQIGTLGAWDGEAIGAVVDAQDSPVQGRGRSAACWPVRARRCSRTRFRRLRPVDDGFVDVVDAIDAQGYTALATGRSWLRITCLWCRLSLKQLWAFAHQWNHP